MRAIVFAHGDLNPGPLVDRVLAESGGALRIAADGGAYHAAALGVTLDVIVGDMDSLAEVDLTRLNAQGVAIQRYPAAKDETDLELALRYAVAHAADRIDVIGAFGDRLDQTLANVLLLTLPELAGRDLRLVAGRQMARLLAAGTHALAGEPGDTLSLIPLGGDALGVTTDGLVYPLRAETLRFGPARGVSNVFSAGMAAVRFEAGLLLAVHTLGRA